MLKRKIEVNYRKAVSTRDGRHNCCKCCGHRMLVDIHAIGGAVLRQDWRCEEIGLDNSRRYSVVGDHVCDRVTVITAETLEHLRRQL